MTTATLIRHRHQTQYILNDRIDKIEHEDHFKVVFSHPEMMNEFQQWCIDNGGKYDYNRRTNKQEGELPEKVKELFSEDVGWCDLIEYFLLHVAQFQYHSSIHPFKGKVFTK